MGQLDGRSIVITGGNGGIGLGMAHAVGAAGARVVIWGRNGDKNGEALAALTASGVDAHSIACDVAVESDVETAFAESVRWAGGRIDSLVANAGRPGTGRSLVDTTLDQWREVMATNLDGVFLCFRAAAAHMIDGGHGGSLVAVSSTSAIHGAANNEAYGASKTALLGMVRGLAVALARHQIRVNALLPGWTLTDMAAAGYANDKFRTNTIGRTPVRRWADPAEMGPAAVFLTDPSITFHTGDTMTVDGGYTIF